MRLACSGILFRCFFGLIVLLVLETGTALAAGYYVAPAPLGNDGNDCLSPQHPCATFQHAADLCAAERPCGISAAAGVYSQRINVTHFKFISINGQQNSGCRDRTAVVLDNRISGASENGPIVWVQDHATLMLECLTLASYKDGAVGFATRQFAIGDINDVDFLGFPDGIGVSASETSKINILNAGIRGGASRFASASELSQISFAGTLRVADGLTFDVAFLSSLFGSVVSVDPVSITGGSGVKGASYQCKDSVIIKSVILPGGDTPYFENEGCLMSGKNAEQHPIARLRAELIEKSERQFAAVEAKLTQQDAIELKRQDAIEAKLTQQDALAAWLAEEESRRSHQQQRHNRIDDILIGVVALLLLGNAVLLWRYWGPRIARRQP